MCAVKSQKYRRWRVDLQSRVPTLPRYLTLVKYIAKQAKTTSAWAGLQHNVIIILMSCHT